MFNLVQAVIYFVMIIKILLNCCCELLQKTIESYKIWNVGELSMNPKKTFINTSVTQMPILERIFKEYKYVTALTMAVLLLFGTAFGAYHDLSFEGPMEVAEVTKDPGVMDKQSVHKPVISVPTEKTNKPFSYEDRLSQTIITLPVASTSIRPFIAATAMDTVDRAFSPILKGFTLDVDGRNIGFFKTQAEAQTVLGTFKKKFESKGQTALFFKEAVKVAFVDKTPYEFKGYSETAKALAYIERGTDVEKIHVVQEGETFWNIAQQYDMDIDALISANPKLDPEFIKPGDKVSLIVPKALITVCTVELIKYTEEIPAEVKYTEAANLFKGQVQVKVDGSVGVKAVEAQLIKENGVPVKRLVLSEKVVKNPSTRIVAKGIKTPPKTAASGIFAKPFSRGKFSSPFGRRWGRMHTGIDWSMPIGSPVKSADGGTVVSAGRDGAYGNCIVISHGNGFKTLYAHNSRILVKVGDKVYKGQLIAKSGNSGRSTGPHLHFEVQKNGVQVNPLKYLK